MRERLIDASDVSMRVPAIDVIGSVGLVGAVDLEFASGSRGGGGSSGSSPNGDRPNVDPAKDERIVRPVQPRPPKG